MSRGPSRKRKTAAAPRTKLVGVSHQTQITPGRAICEIISLVKESKAKEAEYKESDDNFFFVWGRHRAD